MKVKFDGPMGPVNVPAQVKAGMDKAKLPTEPEKNGVPAPKSADLPAPLPKK